MRTNNISVKITVPIPYDRPDENGVIYSTDAVADAVNKLRKNIPIIYRDNERNSDGIVIGKTTGASHIVRLDLENKICNVTVEGNIFCGGLEEVVRKFNGDKVEDFEILSIGISR